jgi:hypothetical protein
MVNKFDRPVQKDWSWQTAQLKAPTLDYEMLNSIAMEKQAEYDSIASLKGLVPRALPWNQSDLAIQQKYRTDTDKDLADVTNAYLVSPQAGAMAFRNVKAKIQKAWQPGGEADMLNKRTDAYFEGRKAIDEYYKDETNPAFKQYAYDQLEQQSKSDNKYNPQTGEYQAIRTPELFKNPDLRKTILDTVAKINESGTSYFTGPDAAHYIHKYETSGKPADQLQTVAEYLMQQPEFANQLKVEQWYQDRDGLAGKRKDDYVADITAKNLALEEQAKKAALGEGTKDFQQLLIEQGYNITPDGDYDEKTKKAAQDFLEKQRLTVQKNINDPDLEGKVSRNKLTGSYTGYARGLANEKKNEELIHDKNYEIAVRARSDRERTAAMLQLNDRLAPVAEPNVTATTSAATNLATNFEMLDSAKTSKTSLESSLDNQYTKDPNSVFYGAPMSAVMEAQRLFDETPTALDGKNLSEEQRLTIFSQKLAANTDYRHTPEEATKIYKAIAGNSNLKQSINELGKIEQSIDRINDNTIQMAGQYVNTEEGVKNLKSISLFRKPGETDVQLIVRAINSPSSFESTVPGASYAGKNTITNWFKDEKDKVNNFNPAVGFKERMVSDVKANKSGMTYKTNNSFAIHADNKDDYLYPTMSRVTDALNSQDQLNFSSEGKSGLVFRNKDGETFTPSDKPVFTNTFVDVGADGIPVLKATGYVGKGGDKAVVTTTMDLHATNPVTSDIKLGLEKNLAQAVATGNYQLVEPLARNLTQFNPEYLGTLKQLKEAPLRNLKSQDIKMVRQDGQPTTTAQEGFKSRVLSTETVAGKTYSINVGQDLTGRKVYFQTTPQVDPSGNLTGKQVIAPLQDGSQFTTDPGVIHTSNTIRQVISKTPVERKITKVPQGTVQAITNFADE